MGAARSPVTCERSRARISVQADGELSQLERVMLGAHLVRCPDCRLYAAEVAAFTRVLREAPLERMEAPVVLPRRRRVIGGRLQAGVAAALAFVAFGLAGQLGAGQPRDSSLSRPGAPVTRYPSRAEVEHEMALLEIARQGGYIMVKRDGKPTPL